MVKKGKKYYLWGIKRYLPDEDFDRYILCQIGRPRKDNDSERAA